MSELRKRRDRRIKEMRGKGLKPDLSKIYVSDETAERFEARCQSSRFVLDHKK